ncbi:hypothetical protein GUITHDRAFT_110082 [Guillardia theta CCMP2712]|uniref:Uncharacterized protein n=1 Tax=Guillardia theta (strain CCMP2712) TaxID=905079 RepID=L1J797_GUITC|nr:hypothetical protein GUITHDRAFT_110082 [Guillardia theta CCMP2712]EKX43974.1 hypothetical protein GUITHDRAFT_110082 [Guillardia theta CCMP2712]|eukprot:XP_005830954.1 hypothetical protein GUITHDRAFT_110082 [Guillardia theta CCMP2712]
MPLVLDSALKQVGAFNPAALNYRNITTHLEELEAETTRATHSHFAGLMTCKNLISEDEDIDLGQPRQAEAEAAGPLKEVDRRVVVEEEADTVAQQPVLPLCK